MRLRLFAIVLLLLTLTGRFVLGQENASVSGVLYEPLHFDVDVDPNSYRNPFDSSDIEVVGVFQSPNGRQIVIPGFWMLPYEVNCDPDCNDLALQPAAEPVWQIRFTPQEAGEWTYTLQVRDNNSLVRLDNGTLRVEDSDHPGFIGKGENGRYFQYSDGQPYFPIGHNLKWSWDEIGGIAQYDRWLRSLSEAGGNYARLYIDAPWFISLEWQGPVGDYRSSQRAAAELDWILEQAEEYGIHLQIVLLWHQALKTYNGPPVLLPEDVERPDMSADWDDNPYNILNGGLLSGPSVFFFDEEAQDMFRRRLRYVTARWGFSPQIFAWEIIDRIDQTENYDSEVSDVWLLRMASYLRQTDQHGHLITAGSMAFNTRLANNALLDFTSAQFYQRLPIESSGDQVASVVDIVRGSLEPNLTPVMLTDYSLSPWFEPVEEDPIGVHFQNTFWASVMSGASGGAVSDWWDSYVIPQDLDRYYAPLAAFTAGIDWPELDLQPAQGLLLSEDMQSYLPLRIDDFNRQFIAPLQNVQVHTITADGVYPDVSDVPSFLYGQIYNNHLSQVQHFRVALPADTYLEIGIEAVSTQADAQLVVQVDTLPGVSLSLRAGTRDSVVRVPLSAGEHTIILDNLGEDWLELAYLEVGQLIAPARVLTLRDSTAGVALAWLQHRDYTWDKVAANTAREAISGTYRLGEMPPGRYVAEVWDPLTGAVLGEELLRVGADGILMFNLLPMDRQLAIRAILQPELVTPEPESPVPTSLPFVAATNTALPLSTPSS